MNYTLMAHSYSFSFIKLQASAIFERSGIVFHEALLQAFLVVDFLSLVLAC
jgi:hypothetical protein